MPFVSGESLRETPPLVANAIAGALAKDPNARLRTATEFRDALGATAYGLRSPRLLTKTARRGVVAALCVVVIAALGIVVSRRHRALVIPSASTIAVVPFAPSTPDSALTRLGRDAHGMVASMSKKGDCWDNAVAESFFATLETEVIMEAAWPTRAAARQAIFAYIETWPGTTGSGDTRASATAVPCSTGLLLVHVARAAITGLPDESKTMASRCQPKPTGNVSESGQTLTRATDVGRSLGSVAAGWGHSNRCTRR